MDQPFLSFTKKQMPPQSATTIPYRRLSSFYFFYFASLGTLLPYWSLYLKDLGYTPAAIGELTAVIMITRIISPNLWARVADYYAAPVKAVRLACFACILGFAAIYLGQGYWWLVLVSVAFSFFWNAALPQFEAATFEHLGKYSYRYSHLRLWGSIGFIVMVTGLGRLFDNYPINYLPLVILVLFIGLWLTSLSVPECGTEEHQHKQHVPLLQVIRHPSVLALFASCFLMQAGHGPYYAFYSIFLEENGYSHSMIGRLWALGVIAEIGVFLLMHRLMHRFSLRFLILLSLLLAALRWWMIGMFVDVLPLLISAQLLHAASFASYHAAAIQLVYKHFKGAYQSRGQALYTSISFGAGGAVGTLMGGYTWHSLTPQAAYYIASILTLLGVYITWRWMTAPQALSVETK